MLSHCSFISVLLHFLLFPPSVCTGYVSNLCHDATHVYIICNDTMTLPFEFLKHDIIEVDPLLQGCSVLILGLQIPIRFVSISPEKELAYPSQGT